MFGEKQMIIEVDEENENFYCGGKNDYYPEEFEDEHGGDPYQDRYTKYDYLEEEALKHTENVVQSKTENPTEDTTSGKLAAENDS